MFLISGYNPNRHGLGQEGVVVGSLLYYCGI
jgi:hypothetical protein